MAARRRNYVNNADLLEEIRKSKEKLAANPDMTPAECLTPKLVSMLMELVANYAKHPSWRNYSYNDEMQSEAIAGLCQNALKFDPEKGSNPFGYYTQIAKRCFITYKYGEDRIRDIRDDMIEMDDTTDFKPSHARQMNAELDKLDYTKRNPTVIFKHSRKGAAAKRPEPKPEPNDLSEENLSRRGVDEE